jgi:hypothetical protein
MAGASASLIQSFTMPLAHQPLVQWQLGLVQTCLHKKEGEKVDLKEVTSNFQSLIAILGFGVVVAGSGYQGMEPNSTIAGLGVVIIFVDLFLWFAQKRKHPCPHRRE